MGPMELLLIIIKHSGKHSNNNFQNLSNIFKMNFERSFLTIRHALVHGRLGR